MTPDMTVVSKHGFVSLVTSGIDVALASGPWRLTDQSGRRGLFSCPLSL